MKTFRLFEFLNQKIKKNIIDSKLYEYVTNNINIVDEFIKPLNLTYNINTPFTLLKAYIMIEILNNKQKIENSVGNYKETHENLPYISYQNMNIYIPIFNEEINAIYDKYYTELNKFPYNELKNNYLKEIINPFAHYGYDLFNSNFTSLKLINIHKHQVYFYFEEFETILSITDQGTLEVAIPLFDYDHIKRSFDDLKPKLIKLMEYYHNFDRENFILELLNSNFISKDLYDKINHLTIKKNKKIIQRISESKKRYIKKNLQ